MTIKGTIDDYFVEMNPIVKTFPEFSSIIENNSKEEANKILWAIYMIECPNPKHNPHADTPRDQRIEDIRESYYPLDIIKYAEVMQRFSIRFLSFEEQMFSIQKEKMDEAQMLYKNLDLENKEGFARFIALSGSFGKMWKSYKDAKEDLLKMEDSKEELFGKGNLGGGERRRRDRKQGKK